jgi:hypothetical protein
MKAKHHLAIVAPLLLLIGCVPSVFPLFNPADGIHNPLLAGTWGGDDDGKELWTFEESGDKEAKYYKLTILDRKGRTADLRATLGSLNGKLFMDITPDSLGKSSAGAIEDQMNDWTKLTLIPGHLVLRVWQIEPELKLGLTNPDRISDMLEADPQLLAHRGKERDGIVLAAPTKQLQAFFTKYADDPKLFEKDNANGMKRRPGPVRLKE